MNRYEKQKGNNFRLILLEEKKDNFFKSSILKFSKTLLEN